MESHSSTNHFSNYTQCIYLHCPFNHLCYFVWAISWSSMILLSFPIHTYRAGRERAADRSIRQRMSYETRVYYGREPRESWRHHHRRLSGSAGAQAVGRERERILRPTRARHTPQSTLDTCHRRRQTAEPRVYTLLLYFSLFFSLFSSVWSYSRFVSSLRKKNCLAFVDLKKSVEHIAFRDAVKKTIFEKVLIEENVQDIEWKKRAWVDICLIDKKKKKFDCKKHFGSIRRY